MKLHFTIACFLLVNFVGAQTDTLSAKKCPNTISVNASSLLEKIFKKDVNPDLFNPFLYYMRDIKRVTVRVGVNGWNSRTSEQNIKANETTNRNKFFTGASVGAYLNKEVNKAFSVSYGLNFIGGYIDSTVTFITTVDEVQNYGVTTYFGVAPGVMLKYKINKHMSLFAEYLLPVTMSRSETGTRYSLFPEENTTDRKTNGFSVLFYNPLTIYFSYSF